jgi:nicotinate-nucleotide adenylyltransferase
MGGTFDPIHIGHLAIAEEARESLKLDRILFVPAGRPPHKPGGTVSDPERRFVMAQLAIADNPAFAISRIEIDRAGPSYTADTVEALAAMDRGSRDGSGVDDVTEITLILSAETFSELPSWREPERILDAARLAVVPREGYPAPDPAWLSKAFPGRETRVAYLDGPLVGVSSTDIRERVASGRSIRYLVPAAVETYIAANHLYRTRSGSSKRRQPSS